MRDFLSGHKFQNTVVLMFNLPVLKCCSHFLSTIHKSKIISGSSVSYLDEDAIETGLEVVRKANRYLFCFYNEETHFQKTMLIYSKLSSENT